MSFLDGWRTAQAQSENIASISSISSKTTLRDNFGDIGDIGDMNLNPERDNFGDIEDIEDMKTNPGSGGRKHSESCPENYCDEYRRLIRNTAVLQNRIVMLTAKTEGWNDQSWSGV